MSNLTATERSGITEFFNQLQNKDTVVSSIVKTVTQNFCSPSQSFEGLYWFLLLL